MIDDDMALTTAWLRSVGCADRDGDKFGLSLVHRKEYGEDCVVFELICDDFANLSESCWSISSMSIELPREVSLLPCVPQTRGELRRLCTALGIPLQIEVSP